MPAPRQCYCGAESSPRFRWCDKCLQQNFVRVNALLAACRGQHRGAGGAAICICGEGCGGSAACGGLSLLKMAIIGAADYRSEVAALFGWEADPFFQSPAPVSSESWRTLDDLPVFEDEDTDWDNRCVVTWQDAENPSDFGVEATTLWHIRAGDFGRERYKNVRWRSLLDAPAFELAEIEEEADDYLS